MTIKKTENVKNENIIFIRYGSINRILIRINEGGQIYPTVTAISPTPTLHLAWFKTSFLSKPTLLLSFSTCVFHVFFGRPRFLLPFTSNSNAFLKTCPSSLLNTCPYHIFLLPVWIFFLCFFFLYFLSSRRFGAVAPSSGESVQVLQQSV